MGEMGNVNRFLIGKHEAKRPLGRPCRRWESNMRMGLRKIRWEVWTGFIWLRIATSG
jgi:hypothetical protein